MKLVHRIVSSFSGISSRLKRTRLSDQRIITAHSGAYARLMMMKSWRKRCRNTSRNLGFGALVTFWGYIACMMGLMTTQLSGQGIPMVEVKGGEYFPLYGEVDVPVEVETFLLDP